MQDQTRSESALETRINQLVRYMTIGLLCLLVVGIMSGVSFAKAMNEKEVAVQNQQVQAETTKNSSFCSIYPDDEVCKMARKIAANPTETVVPKDGTDGKNGTDGQDGRGVTRFATSPEGNLIVTYTDGQTESVGHVVGKDGLAGADGKDGRGILTAQVESGNLIIGFTDGTTKNLGMIVGPAGADGQAGAAGQNGTNGVDGQPGKDGSPGPAGPAGPAGQNGISVVDLKVDSQGYVNVSYSDGSVRPAGRVIVNTIHSMSCQNDTLTITMVDGSMFQVTVDCTPDNIPSIPSTTKPITVP